MNNKSKDFYFILESVKILKNHDLGKGEVGLISVACPNTLDKNGEVALKVETPLFKGVKKKSFLHLGAAGKLLFTSKQLPEFLNWTLWVIEDDSDVRDTGKLISETLESNEFKNIESSIKVVLSSNPVASVVGELVTQAARLLAMIAMKNKDDQIGVIDTTFIHKIHHIDNYSVSGETCGDARLAYSLKFI